MAKLFCEVDLLTRNGVKLEEESNPVSSTDKHHTIVLHCSIVFIRVAFVGHDVVVANHSMPCYNAESTVLYCSLCIMALCWRNGTVLEEFTSSE